MLKYCRLEDQSLQQQISQTELFANTSQGYLVEYIIAKRPTMDHHTQGIRQNIDTNRMDFTIKVFVTL